MLKDPNLVALMRDQDLTIASGILDGMKSLTVVACLPHFFTEFQVSPTLNVLMLISEQAALYDFEKTLKHQKNRHKGSSFPIVHSLEPLPATNLQPAMKPIITQSAREIQISVCDGESTIIANTDRIYMTDTKTNPLTLTPQTTAKH